MNHEKLVAKKIYALKLYLLTPMNIGGSDDENTDHDLIHDGKGKFFLPGTSIAGALFGYCKMDRNAFQLLLQSTDSDTMSKVIISDGCFTKIAENIRDGVALDTENGEKVALDKRKYDYEVAERNSTFEFSMELTLRTRDIIGTVEETIRRYDSEIKKVIAALNQQFIRFGYKKNRGFGCVKVEKATCQEFYGDTLKDFLHREQIPFVPFDYSDAPTSSLYHSIQAEVSLLSGISIRTYSTEILQADSRHIQSDGAPAIPGTSLAGLLRSQMNRIAQSLGYSDFRYETLFGSIDENGGKKAAKTKILFTESYLDGGSDMDSTRTTIDDITGSSLNNHLFTEKVHYKGKAVLNILLDHSVDDSPESKANVALLLLSLFDLENGYCALGGSTSIGRGILLGDSISFDGIAIKKNDTDSELLHSYFNALCEIIKENR